MKDTFIRTVTKLIPGGRQLFFFVKAFAGSYLLPA